MQNSTTLHLLASAMVSRDQPVELAGRPAPLLKYSGLADIRGVEVLGTALAEQLREHRPDRVLIWEEIEDIPLAHVVARELDGKVIRVVNADGLLDFDGDLGPHQRVAIVSDAFRSKRTVDALERMVEHAGSQVVALAALVASPVHDEMQSPTRPVLSLFTRAQLDAASAIPDNR